MPISHQSVHSTAYMDPLHVYLGMSKKASGWCCGAHGYGIASMDPAQRKNKITGNIIVHIVLLKCGLKIRKGSTLTNRVPRRHQEWSANLCLKGRRCSTIPWTRASIPLDGSDMLFDLKGPPLCVSSSRLHQEASGGASWTCWIFIFITLHFFHALYSTLCMDILHLLIHWCTCCIVYTYALVAHLYLSTR